MSMFYKNPLLNKKLIDDVASFMEKNSAEEKRLSPIFLEEAKKASVAIGFCSTAEDASMMKKEFLKTACKKSGEVLTQRIIDEFNAVIEENLIK